MVVKWTKTKIIEDVDNIINEVDLTDKYQSAPWKQNTPFQILVEIANVYQK